MKPAGPGHEHGDPLAGGASASLEVEAAEHVETLEAHVHELEDELRLAKLKLRGIEAISRLLASEHNLDRILTAVMERTTTLMDAERATLFLLDESGERLWSKVMRGETPRTIELPVGQGLAGWVARHGRQVNVKDAYKDPRFDVSTDRESSFRTRSVLCQPLRNTRQQIIGVIQVLNKRSGYFTTADEDLLAAIASQSAIALQNSKLYLDLIGKNIDLQETQMRLEERTAELELLFGIERCAATAASLDQAARGVLDVTMQEFPSALGAVAVLDGRSERFRIAAVAGPEAHRLDPERPTTLLARVFASGQPVVVSGPGEDPELLADLTGAGPDAWPIETLVCVPMIHQDTRVGCLMLVNRQDFSSGFDTREVRLLSLIAGRLALSVVLARAQEEEQKAERLAAIGQMLSGVVHDMKTPLTIIGGYAALMAREADRERRDVHGDAIRKQIGQLEDMTRELLAFARGDSRVLLRKVSISAFMAEISELLREEFSGSGVDLVVETPYRGGVRMDESKMKRVVFNLARNAREAMPQGGRFHIRVEQNADRVLFTFADDGPGLPPQLAGRLFDPFATFGKKHGTGLGLAIVKKIVDEHGGELAVHSEPGRGTTFQIALPLA